MKRVTVYLIVQGNGATRLRASRPGTRELRPDELAFAINIDIPSGWGRLSESVVNLTLPEQAEPTVEVTE